MIVSLVLLVVSLKALGGMWRVALSMACVASFVLSLGVWLGVFGTFALMFAFAAVMVSCVCSFAVFFRYLWRLCCG